MSIMSELIMNRQFIIKIHANGWCWKSDSTHPYSTHMQGRPLVQKDKCAHIDITIQIRGGFKIIVVGLTDPLFHTLSHEFGEVTASQKFTCLGNVRIGHQSERR